jgi:hypothetical protein
MELKPPPLGDDPTKIAIEKLKTLPFCRYFGVGGNALGGFSDTSFGKGVTCAVPLATRCSSCFWPLSLSGLYLPVLPIVKKVAAKNLRQVPEWFNPGIGTAPTLCSCAR